MDAANVDLKAFSEDFYHKLTGGHLQPVLDTLDYIHNETNCWLEVTTLLIPGQNDSNAEIEHLARWFVETLGCDVPLHFSAFHPDYKMTDLPATPLATLRRAREIALQAGLHHVYVGNVHDSEADSTWCPGCHRRLIERDWYELGEWRLTPQGNCEYCARPLAGVFEATPGNWGARRMPVAM
jgi:pyruvate formate lyase activating enzyme